ncbi:sec24-like protein [Cytidiella melzeri]|nr:sec24-like protein [Cytidiella melzeri]
MYAHSTSAHIPQPPHSAGLAYKGPATLGLRAAIDPHQIPSPIEVVEADRETWEGKMYMTLPGSHVPLSTTDYVAFDQGNSTPKFIRVSTWNLPSSSRLASECGIPIAAVIHPFADLDPREDTVPLVDTGSVGPARCVKCRAYVNPWCTWISGGAKWACNLCQHENEVASEYFCNLDANLMRLDHLQRPELNKGTVDFVVPEEYWASHPPPRIKPMYQPIASLPQAEKRNPQTMDYVFVIDVSVDALSSGFTEQASRSLIRMLYGDETGETFIPPCIPPQSRICIMTFDSTVHFYDISPHLERASMFVVADVEDMFVPLSNGLFVYPAGSQTVIQNLLTTLPVQHAETAAYDSALCAAIIGSMGALVGRGGQVVVFAATLPTINPGALKPRDDESLFYDTEKELQLYQPRNETWDEIGQQCAEEGIGVSMFLGMNKPIDIATVGRVASASGGELFFHPRFSPKKDNRALESQLRRLLTRVTVYNCSLRVRCSSGLRVSQQYGNFYENSASDLQFGTLDADKGICVTLSHRHTLDERQYAFLQSAVLYTTVDGQRRVRTCNLALQVVTLAGNVFRFADLDTTVSHMLREAISKMTSQKIAYIQEELTEKCSAILLGYRRNCAAATAPSQLVIPEAFRALPVFTLAMMKSKPLKARNVSSDVRNYWVHKFMGMGVQSIMHHLYPRLLALHDLDDQIALPKPDFAEIELPSLMRNSHLFMTGNGVYLIDNEEMEILWIGQSVSPQILTDLLGVDDVSAVDRDMTALPLLATTLSAQVHNILASRLARRGREPKFAIARQNLDGLEVEFSDMLVEDQNNGALSYLDYLCIVHKQISTVLTTGASLSSSSSFRGSIW